MPAAALALGWTIQTAKIQLVAHSKGEARGLSVPRSELTLVYDALHNPSISEGAVEPSIVPHVARLRVL